MGTVFAGLSMSLDGYIGGTADQGWTAHERLLGWVFNLKSWRERLGMQGGGENAASALVTETFARPGAYVMGKRMFDAGAIPWGDNPPFRAPVFVLTHQPREPLPREGGTRFNFVTDGIESAIRQAKDAAGEKDVQISGGASAVQQALAAGLLDEIQIHLVPVLLGQGVRLFNHLGAKQIELERTRMVETEGMTHLTFQVVK